MPYVVPLLLSPPLAAGGAALKATFTGAGAAARYNDLVVPDPRISRHHARLQVRRGSLLLTDLGSTNGTQVNGVRVDEVVLGEADEIEIGDTVLVVESLPTA